MKISPTSSRLRRALLLASVWPGVAFGQTADPEPDTGEIIVTAQKREQSINSVGLTVVAASAEALEERGVVGIEDLGKVVSGFTYTEARSVPVYTLRGIGLYDSGIGSSPSVALYVDQVPLSFPAMAVASTLDLERLEVLKGPQGTLFGQSATGGAINFIAAKPTDQLSAGMSASFESFVRSQIDAHISGPLNDVVSARLSARVIQGGAWQRSISRPADRGGATRQQMARLLVDVRPSDRLNISLNVNGWLDKSDPVFPQFVRSNLLVTTAPDPRVPFEVVDPAVFASLTTPGSPNFYAPYIKLQNTQFNRVAGLKGAAAQRDATAFLGGPYGDGRSVPDDARLADWSTEDDQQAKDSFYQLSGRADYELTDTLTLTSISSFARLELDRWYDGDGTIGLYSVNGSGFVKNFSQELRIAGDTDRVHWLVGANYDRTTLADISHQVYPWVSLTETLPGLEGYGSLSSFRSRVTNYAVYGNAEVELTDRLTAHGGVRWTDSRRTGINCISDLPGRNESARLFGNSEIVPGFGFYDLQTALGLPAEGHVVLVPGQCTTLNGSVAPTDPRYLRPVVEPYETELNEDNVSWRGGLNYKFDQGALIYGTVSQGYKSGLVTAIPASTTQSYVPAKQEKVIAYEAGFKAPILDRSVQLNAAAFYYDYSDKQVRFRLLDPIFGLLETLVNIPKSEIYGIEVELHAEPTEGLNVSASGAYVRSKVTGDFADSEGRTVYNQAGYTGNFKGSSLPYTPRFSGVADAQYSHPLSERVSGFLGGTVTYQSRDNATFYTDVARADAFFRRARTLIDLRAGLATDDGSWKLTLYGRNITDKFYEQSVYGGEIENRFAGKPATYGISLETKF